MYMRHHCIRFSIMNKIPAILIFVLSGLFLLPSCKRNADNSLTNLSIGHSKDLTLAGDMELPNGTQHIVIKIKGDKLRTDLESLGISTIQSASGSCYILNHSTKTIQKQNVPEIPAIGKEDAAKLSKAFVMKFTGKTDTIAGWKTHEFLLCDYSGDSVPAAGQVRMTAWIADDFPEGLEIQRLLERVIPNQILASMEKTTGKRLTMPGFALRTETHQGGQQQFKVTLTAIKQGDLPDNDFDLPKNYMQSLSK